jgi:HTH-type transcriptional regulator, transcriptional repressor of NAD biosynthesis genes
MTRGLVIGKFLPIHKGHVALIEFAKTHCDELIVSMSRRADDVIDPDLRLGWIREIFKNDFRVTVTVIDVNFDDDSLPWDERTKVWAELINGAYPEISVLISSEEYGMPLAKHLGAAHVSYDPERINVPVSASLIRDHPFKHWDFLPEVVRPHFVKKVCLYGPESTGKSIMAQRLASKYSTESVPEVAREFLSTNVFDEKDLVDIGLAHLQRIFSTLKTANKILFCDTDVITTQIYANVYLGTIPSPLREFEYAVQYDHYFLFDIDVPWVPDGLRDLGHRREEMFNLFKKNLEDRAITYTLVTGNWSTREATICETLEELFGL